MAEDVGNYIDSFMIDGDYEEDEDYDFETDLLSYDTSQIDDEISESIRKQQNEDLIRQIEPISTATRLEMYPEMHQLKPRTKRMLEEMRQKKRERLANQPRTVATLLIVKQQQSVPPAVLTVGDILKDKEMRKEAENPMQVVICTICGNVFGSKFVLQRHLKKHSDGVEMPTPSFVCPIQGCSMRCDAQSTLNEHVRQHHSRADVVYKNFTFVSLQDFEAWKEELEEESNSRFVYAYATNNQRGRSARYSCFFSHVKMKVNPDAPKIRDRPSKKLASTCTAHLVVKETFGTVSVKACLVHCGHSTTRRVPLSTAIRKEIAAALIQGLDENTIVNNFKEASTPDDRRHRLQNYEVRNVLNKLMKNGFRPGASKTVSPSREEPLRATKDESQEKERVEILEAPPFVTEEEVF